jgi:hypothetical protein
VAQLASASDCYSASRLMAHQEVESSSLSGGDSSSFFAGFWAVVVRWVEAGREEINLPVLFSFSYLHLGC